MNKEHAASLIFLFAGIYGLFYSIQLPMGKWSAPGPGVFPLGISALLFLSGIIWFIQDKSKEEKKARVNVRGILKDLITPLKIIGLTAAFILCLKQAGYLVASILYLFFLLLLVSHYKLWTAVGLAVLFAVGSWYFFGRILAVQLPSGFFSL